MITKSTFGNQYTQNSMSRVWRALLLGITALCLSTAAVWASPKIVSVSVTPTSSSPTLAGSNATYAVVVGYTTGAGFDGTLSQTNTLPAGVTVTFTPSLLTIPKGTGTLTSTMTVDSPAGMMTTNIGLCVMAAVDKQLGDHAVDCSASLSVVSTNPPSCSITGPTVTNAFTSGLVYTDTTDAATPSYSWSMSGNGTIAGATTNHSVTINAGAVGSFDLTCLVIDLANGKSNTCSQTVTINKANPSITTWPTATDITYGQTLADSTLSGGVSTPDGTFAFESPSTTPNAGTASQSVIFTPTDTANYNVVTGAVSVTVNKATPDVTDWPTATDIIFGQTLADSTLSGGSASVPGAFAFTTPSTAPSAGTASQSVTFTPTDTANYNTVIGSTSVTVLKATPSVTDWPTASDITYGQTLADSILTGGSSTVPGSFAFTTPSTAPNAGTASQSVTFTPTDTANYNTVIGSTSVTVLKATPSVTDWPTASDITYGQTLADSTLTGGSASVPGGFAFTTPSTAPNAGTAAQSVTFTPTDTANYNTVVGSVNVTVNKADPTVTTWPTASDITYGQTLADSTLSGGDSSVAGTFAFTTPSTMPNVGTAAQSVTFTPTDSANYNTVVGSADVTVNKADPSITDWPTASAINAGQTLADSTLTGGTGSVPGSFAFTTPSTMPPVGTNPQSVTFTPTDTANYNSTTGTVNVTVLAGQLAVMPDVLDFGAVATGTTSQASFTVTNAASGQLTGTATIIEAGPFEVVTNTIPYTVAGFSSTNVDVTFTPVAEGFFTNLVEFATDGGTVTNAVTGQGAVEAVALFSATPTNGVAFLPVTFTDESTGTITNWFWDFGNGVTSNTAGGAVDFTFGAGTFPVTLIVSGPLGSSTNTMVTITVDKADPSITTWPTASDITYGQTLADSLLTGGVSTPDGTFAFESPSTAPNAGTDLQSVIFTPTDTANYNVVTGTVSVTVNKATPDVTGWPTASDITYGQTLADSLLSGGTASVPGSFAFTTPSTAPNAGTAAQSVTFTPTDTANYNTVVGSVNVTVLKATPSITTWPTASDITYGQTLEDSLLTGGAATPDGAFGFTNPSIAPNAGTAAQSVTFYPADSANYNTVVGSVDVTVNKATPSVTDWPTAGDITEGQTLADSILSGGSASVPGTFSFETPSTAPGVGTSSQNVIFTPTDSANYNSVTGTVSVTVISAGPKPPVAGSYTNSVDEDQTLNVPAPGLLSVVTDPDSAELTAIKVSDPAHGTLTLNPDGSFIYTPNPDFNGEDSFTFMANDGTNDSNVATATIVVNPVPDAPVAQPDTYATPQDTLLSVPASGVLTNDTDADDDVLSAELVSTTTHGALSLNADGSFTYMPTNGYNGYDSFVYVASDGELTSSNTTVMIAVGNLNTPPVANNDSYTVAEDDELTVAAPGVLGNDTDAQEDTLTAILVTGTAHGTVTLNPDGSFTYVPANNYNGPDSFTYKANDGEFDSNVATVNITVTPVDGASDIDLYVAKSKFSESWTRTHHDSYQVKGRMNPRGANANLAGATMLVAVNGVDLFTPLSLDSKGHGVMKLGSVIVVANFNSKNGRYRFKITGTNLRPIFSFPDITRTDSIPVNVQVTINGAGLDVSSAAAQLLMNYHSVQSRGTRGGFLFRNNRTLTGVFNLRSTQATQLKDGTFNVQTFGKIENEGGSPVIPTGPLTVRIGSDTPVPSQQVKVSLTDDGLTVNLRGKKLANTGIPLTGAEAATSYRLPIQIIVTVGEGTQTFETIIELKRATPTSKHWKR
jgi:VCBS repeat-containing protein